MVQKKLNKKTKKVVTVARKSAQVKMKTSSTRRAVPKAVADHAKMIMDPCGAMLVHPVYSGSGSGTLVRMTSQFTIGQGATAGASGVYWTPGAFFDGNTALNPCIVTFSAASLGTATTVTNFTPAVPGAALLSSATVGKYRCLGACMSLVPNASVMNRSGRYNYGLSEGTQVVGAIGVVNAFTPAQEATQLVNYCDASGTVEVFFRPDFKDQEFVDATQKCANADEAADAISGRCTMGVIASGYPLATGYTVRCTAIYEVMYTGKNGTGFDMSRARSAPGSLDSVLDLVEDLGFSYATAMAGPMGGMAFKGVATLARQQMRN